MKSTKMKRWAAMILSAMLVASAFAGCTSKDGGSSSEDSKSGGGKSSADSSSSSVSDEGTGTDGQPETWIADRTINIQAYVDDIGYNLPENLDDTPAMQELTKRTGIKLNIQYTPGDSDSAVLSSQLAAGSIPDVIVSYLNDSTRPEFPILLKAAKEEMFADVSGYIKDTQVYSKYYDEGYLPRDSRNNIVFREEFGDSVYLLPLQVDEIDRTEQYLPESEFRGGMYIQTGIVETLGIDPRDIKTQEDLYGLLVKIKAGGFKDDNGNDVYPLGPKYWGGSVDSMRYVLRELNWSVGSSDFYNMDKDGNILHEVETEYALDKVNYVRKLLAEGLMNPEFFTMDQTRAEEASKTKNSAIIGDVHNYVDAIYDSEDYVPLGPLNTIAGNSDTIVKGKTINGVWAISADAEKPEEILAFFDYLSTKEGQMICQYGAEGQTYEMENDQPRLTTEVQEKLDAGDTDWLINNTGASLGGNANYLFEMIVTNRNNIDNFGEERPGSAAGSTYKRSVQVAEDYPLTKKKVEGLDPTAYLSIAGMEDVKMQMDLLNYEETLVQAYFAESDDNAKAIIDSFKGQLESSGLDKFKAELKKVYDEDPTAICFYIGE